MMKDIKCPVFMVHGEADNLIPSTHTQQLFEVLKSQKEETGVAHLNYSVIRLVKTMTHNDFDLH